MTGDSRRVGYVGGGIGWDGWTQGKCSFTRYKDILAGTAGKGKQGQAKGKGNGCIAWWKLEITRQARQEIDEIEKIVVKGNKTRVSTVHATSKKEPALLQHGTTSYLYAYWQIFGSCPALPCREEAR